MSPRTAIFGWLRRGTHEHRSPLSQGSAPAHEQTAAGVEGLTLADLDRNERARVLGLSCGRQAANRLVSLGFTPGAEVGMTQNYGHGPIIVLVRGARVALGRREARHIQVERNTA
jgi:ferrous iron transport protein A